MEGDPSRLLEPCVEVHGSGYIMVRLQALASSWLHCAAYCRSTCTMSTLCTGIGITRPATFSPAFLQSDIFQGKIALACGGKHYSYIHLLNASTQLADLITKSLPGVNRECLLSTKTVNSMHSPDVQKTYEKQPRVAILCENDISYVAALFGIWSLGCIAVPLCKTHPKEELRYVLKDSSTTLLVSTQEFANTAKELAGDCDIVHISATPAVSGDLDASLGRQLVGAGEEAWSAANWGELGALIVYTSGTTGRPKGVLSTHGNISAQVSMLLQAWGWRHDDVILHSLPLHHLHGILNALLCPLTCGATVVMHKIFQPKKVWSTLLGEDVDTPPVTVFTGVPTMYAKMVQYFEQLQWGPGERERYKRHLQESVRLMMSGSAALPESLLHKWKEVSGHCLLERYGMTELGMALSNPLHGNRIPGSVGTPLPTVEARIDEEGSQDGEREKGKGLVGELQIRGPAVFKGYWGKAKETSDSFTEDGWFKTGDTASYHNGVYHILGRTSVDIIKSGGYKISALDVERVLLEHPCVTDCAVVGIPDKTWGEKVAAVIVPAESSGDKLTINVVEMWCKDRLAAYKIPRTLRLLDSLPRNVMGKVNKRELRRALFDC